MAWMEEKSLHLAGGGSLPGGVPGDIPLVELAGVERSKYDQWLRRFGKEARTELWWPLMKARRQLREAADDRSEEDVGDESSVEDDASDDASE